MSIADEIKQSFKSGNNLIKLIYINIGVWLAVQLVKIFFFLFAVPVDQVNFISWFAVPAHFSSLVTKPWTVFTYMFLHEDFLHILFNMLWLYFLGRIFLQYLDEKKLLSVYILGGLTGALIYILAFNIFPVFDQIVTVSYALGASASVMAVVVAIAVYAPDYNIYIWLISSITGPIKLKWIAVFTILIDLLSIPSSNSGGHIAHLGGAIFGVIYILQYRKGKNIASGFDRFMDNIFSVFRRRKNRIKVTYHRPVTDYDFKMKKKEEQDEIDRILDKIAQGGYDSLTKAEKEKLFRAGK
ncbi:MAG: rhomboid family intramembrane serine protease [Bacteroidota bacterium]